MQPQHQHHPSESAGGVAGNYRAVTNGKVSRTLTTPGSTMEVDALSVDRYDISSDESRRLTRIRRIRQAVGLFLLTFIVFIVADSLTNKYIKTGMNSFLEWVEANPGGGVLVFMLVIFCTTMLFIPGIILTFGSGYVFANAFGLGLGVLMGSIVVFVGAGAGAILSFLLGRFLLRDCVSGLTKKFKFFEALDNAMEEKGFRIMLLLRLSPLIYASPYLNYGAGGMAVSFTAYLLSLFAILPATVMFVFLGASAGSLADSSGGNSKATTIVLVIGIIFSVIAVALTTFYARQELRKVTMASERDQETGAGEDDANENDEGDQMISSTNQGHDSCL